ncbi:hypothetical protein MHYP_G00092570 [Metynnis hypsauchen]
MRGQSPVDHLTLSQLSVVGIKSCSRSREDGGSRGKSHAFQTERSGRFRLVVSSPRSAAQRFRVRAPAAGDRVTVGPYSVKDEFRRITAANLERTSLTKLDFYTPNLLTVFEMKDLESCVNIHCGFQTGEQINVSGRPRTDMRCRTICREDQQQTVEMILPCECRRTDLLTSAESSQRRSAEKLFPHMRSLDPETQHHHS